MPANVIGHLKNGQESLRIQNFIQISASKRPNSDVFSLDFCPPPQDYKQEGIIAGHNRLWRPNEEGWGWGGELGWVSGCCLTRTSTGIVNLLLTLLFSMLITQTTGFPTP